MIFLRKKNGHTDGGAGGGELLLFSHVIRNMHDDQIVTLVRELLAADTVIGDLAGGEIESGATLDEAITLAKKIRQRQATKPFVDELIRTRRVQFAANHESLMLLLIARDGCQCKVCGSIESLTLDHVLPLSRGGTDEPDNLQILCRSCNSRKGAR
jgi:hypothetical protein